MPGTGTVDPIEVYTQDSGALTTGLQAQSTISYTKVTYIIGPAVWNLIKSIKSIVSCKFSREFIHF